MEAGEQRHNSIFRGITGHLSQLANTGDSPIACQPSVCLDRFQSGESEGDGEECSAKFEPVMRQNGLTLQVRRAQFWRPDACARPPSGQSPAVPVRRAFPVRIGGFLALASAIHSQQFFVMGFSVLGQTTQVFFSIRRVGVRRPIAMTV